MQSGAYRVGPNGMPIPPAGSYGTLRWEADPDTRIVRLERPGPSTPMPMTMAQACQMLGVSVYTGYEMAKDGDFPGELVKIRGRWHVSSLSGPSPRTPRS